VKLDGNQSQLAPPKPHANIYAVIRAHTFAIIRECVHMHTLQGTSAAGVTSGGAITMQLCEVVSPGAVGIGVVGQGRAMVRRCTVTGASDCGILVQDMARYVSHASACT
jgi:hypothetical protein